MRRRIGRRGGSGREGERWSWGGEWGERLGEERGGVGLDMKAELLELENPSLSLNLSGFSLPDDDLSD